MLTHSLILLKHLEGVDEGSVFLAGRLVDTAGLELLHASNHAVEPFLGHAGQHLLRLNAERRWLTICWRAIAGTVDGGRHCDEWMWRQTAARQSRLGSAAFGECRVVLDGLDCMRDQA